MSFPRWPIRLCLALFALACTGSEQKAPPEEAAFQTDATLYRLDRDERGWGVAVPFRFRNAMRDTMYVVNCNGAYSIALEKNQGGSWENVWTPLVNGCLSPPITIHPGAVYHDTLKLWGARPGTNVGPAFTDTTFRGRYRLVWWNLVLHYQAGRGGFGDTIPLRHRVSNEFELHTKQEF